MLRDPNNTYEDISRHLKERGYDISRWAVARYGAGFFACMQRMRVVEEKARTLTEGEEAPEHFFMLERAASKLLSEKVISLLLAEEMDVKDLSRMLGDFSRHQSSGVRREKLKADLAEKMGKTAEAVKKTKKPKGLSEHAAAEIRKKILGLDS
jgi:hypothetical protein